MHLIIIALTAQCQIFKELAFGYYGNFVRRYIKPKDKEKT